MTTAPAPDAEASKGAGGANTVVVQVLAAIATGVGVLGFVTFFGGAILWVRAREGGLPANDVVAVIPKPVLVTTGASFLVPAVLFALGAIGLIYLIHLSLSSGWWRRLKSREQATRTIDTRRRAHDARLRTEPLSSFALRAREIADRSRKSYEDANAARAALEGAGGQRAEGLDEHVELVRQQARADELRAQEAEQRARSAEAPASVLVAEADRAEAELQLARTISPKNERVQRRLDVGAALVVLCIGPLVFEHRALFQTVVATVILGFLAFASFGLSVAAYLATGKFKWFGAVAFAAISMFIGAATYFRTKEQLKVEPAAVLLDDRRPAIGWFVAQDSDDLYLATFEGDEAAALLRVVPRSQVKDLAVGPLLTPAAARTRAIAQATELCSARSPAASGSLAAATSAGTTRVSQPGQACGQLDLLALRRELEVAYGKYCTGLGAIRAPRRPGNGRDLCVTAMANLASDQVREPDEACEVQTKDLTGGESSAFFQACKRAGLQLLRDR